MAGTIWLVGLMGAGKTAVGAALAARLGVPFADSDAEIERAAGCTIPEIFEGEGEAAFRAREREAIARLATQAGVVALGGGAIAQPGQAAALAASGTVVYLRARPETLAARVGGNDGRPLLAGLDGPQRCARLAALLEERREAYESASVLVDTDDREIDAVVGELAARLEAAA